MRALVTNHSTNQSNHPASVPRDYLIHVKLVNEMYSTENEKNKETKLQHNGRDLTQKFPSITKNCITALLLESSSTKFPKMLWKLDGVALEDIIQIPKAQPVSC